MSDDHPHIYNLRGYCWCGVHRDDWLSDPDMQERIDQALKKLSDAEAQPSPSGERKKEFLLGIS